MYGRLQQPDGYLSSWYQRIQPGQRWTNLRDWHELYCAGHLIEGAVAYFQATGKRKLLDVMLRYADHIASVVRPRGRTEAGYCGHEEIELALVKLDRVTGERHYLDLAQLFHRRARPAAALLRRRGARARRRSRGLPLQDLRIQPVAQAGARAGQGRRPRRARDVPLFRHGRPRRRISATTACGRRSTGCGPISPASGSTSPAASGPSAANEGFTVDYDLPNESAYAETCAAVGLVFWAQPDARRWARRALRRRDGAGALQRRALRPLARRLAVLLREPAGEPRQAPPLELAPLPLLPAQHRAAWWPASAPTSTAWRDDAIAVHLYGESDARSTSGKPSPHRPAHALSVGGRGGDDHTPDALRRFALKLRIPGWCRQRRFRSTERPWTSAPSPPTATPAWSGTGSPATGCG